MRSVFQRPFLLVFGLIVLAWTMHVPAQTPPKPDGTGTKEAATYEGSQGNLVQVKLGQNSWLMQLDAKAVITYTGPAETDFVELAKSPLMVRFKAEINTRQKKATAPVSEIEIVNVNETNKPGAVADGLGAFDDKPKGPPPETQNLLVTSPVSSYKNGEMTLLGGLKVPVDPMAKVTVTLDGAAALLATPPQANTVISYKYFTKQPGRGILSLMETTGTEPLAAPKKPTPRTPAANAKTKPEPKPEEPKPDEAKPEEKKE